MGRYTKNRTYWPEAFRKRCTREFGGQSGYLPSLRKKIEFWIGGDAISRCLEGLTCTLLSRPSFTFSLH